MTGWRFVSEVFFAGLGTMAFALLFHVPARYYPRCAFTGGAGWLVYLLLKGPLGTLAATLAATLAVSLDNFTFAESFSAALTCISNTGPGLERFGPMGNFSPFSPLSKVILSACMVIGRLEIFPILILFCPGAWKRS